MKKYDNTKVNKAKKYKITCNWLRRDNMLYSYAQCLEILGKDRSYTRNWIL